MILSPEADRLNAVARTYLDAEAPRSRLIIVAGEDPVSTDGACRCLQAAANDLGLPTVVMNRGSETVDLELAHDRTCPVVVYHHGRVRERQLARLRPARDRDQGPDLLLWDLPERERVSMRSLYMLGLWSWAMAPRQVRCVLPPARADDPPISALRDRIRVGLEHVESDVRPETLQRTHSWESRATRTLLGQILQSMVAASSKRSALRASRNAIANAMLFVIVTVAALVFASTSVRAELVTVEIEGISLNDSLAHRSDEGTVLLVGRFHLLRLQPGVATRSADGITITTDRSSLVALVGDESMNWKLGEHRVGSPLTIHAPEFTLQVREGRYSVQNGRLVVWPQTKGPMLPGRQGMAVAGVMLVLIILLFWRATAMRRRIDQPYVSVRKRRPPS